MDIRSISNPLSPVYSLDEILQGIPETAIEELSDIEETYQSFKEQLNFELKTIDRVWLEFQAGQCEQFGKVGKSILYRIVKSSVGHPENSFAAANAITILKIMKVSFSCLDLQGVQIPGADLSNSILDKADLSGANLENVDLSYASLNETNMLRANLKNVKFDAPNTLIHDHGMLFSIITPDNKYLVSEDTTYMYLWHLTSKTYIKKIERPNPFDYNFRKKIFTPDGQFLFIHDGNQNFDIWSVGELEPIKKLKISDDEMKYADLRFSFLANENLFITRYNLVKDKPKGYLKFWDVQKKGHNLLDINLKSEIVIPNIWWRDGICFSKKFPVFYCLTFRFDKFSHKMITLSVFNLEEFFRVSSISIPGIDELNNFFVNLTILPNGNTKASVELAILNMGKNNEELLFIAIGNCIYSVNILKRNEQNWRLESSQAIKIRNDIGTIHGMQILAKTHELIYVCKNAICLYNIRDNQLIGKFRLLDITLNQLTISLDEAKIYINYLNKVFIYSVEALKNNKYISYQLASKAACFSSDIRSIITISSGYFKQVYDIETSNMLESKSLQKMKMLVLNKRRFDNYEITFSSNSQYIFINSSQALNHNLLHIINTENEETNLEAIANHGIFVISNDSKYLALVEFEAESEQTLLAVYKVIPFKQCIGKFYFENSWSFKSRYLKNSQIAISKDFSNTPKVALIDQSNNTAIIYSFVFKNKALELLSHKKLRIEENEIFQLTFTENDSKLIIVCKTRIILWDIENNQHEEYRIQASCADISQNGSLLIYYTWDANRNLANHQLHLWSTIQKKSLIIQTLPLDIYKLQISPDNRYILGTAENGGLYVWKIVENAFRLLWRTSHNLQAEGLILSNDNLEKDFEEELIAKTSAMKITNI